MKFRYDGPFDAVDVPALGETVERGHQVSASGDVAESLLSQPGSWSRVDKPKPRNTNPEPPAAENNEE